MTVPTAPDAFVVAAYGLTVLFLAGYALTIVARRREVARRRSAWSDDLADVD